jgi:(4S)-4-hydroxy-5-phosphonooxypentane-2,3-dione isomerase
MLIALISIHVKPESVDAFKAATIENARNSVLETGIARFDFTQQLDDPTRFALIEVFQDEAAVEAHRETTHYQVWRDTVADMMASPRIATRVTNIFPGDETW